MSSNNVEIMFPSQMATNERVLQDLTDWRRTGGQSIIKHPDLMVFERANYSDGADDYLMDLEDAERKDHEKKKILLSSLIDLSVLKIERCSDRLADLTPTTQARLLAKALMKFAANNEQYEDEYWGHTKTDEELDAYIKDLE